MKSAGGEPGAWHAALTGDVDAFVAIFDLHRNRVYGHALRMTANVHDAEDITAAAFLELWRRRKSVRVVDGSVLPWLLVTSTNLARNLSRSLRRYRALIGSLPHTEAADGAGEIAMEQMEGERIDGEVRRALGALSASDASLLALTTFDHYSPAQVASALGISNGAARTRLHRARTRMAEVLGTSLDGDCDDPRKEDAR